MMYATSANNKFQVCAHFRSIALGALSLLLLIVLLNSLQSASTTRIPTLSVSGFKTLAVERNGTRLPRIKKVTAMFGEPNHLYEAALKTHERHNALHGYEMQVLRQRITGSFLAKPAYLMSILVEELAKPRNERMDWLMWIDPGTIILNPQIPLELFLPPIDEEMNMVGSHDSRGFNGGVFFLRVDQWSLNFLIQVLAMPLTDNTHHVSLAKDHSALEQIMESRAFRHRITYQPRTWFNAFDTNKTFDGVKGDMLVHFPDVSGDKWARMDMYLDNVTMWQNPWEVPLHETDYENRTTQFWGRLREARKLYKDAQGKESDRRVSDMLGRLRFAMEYESDHEEVVTHTQATLRQALAERL